MRRFRTDFLENHLRTAILQWEDQLSFCAQSVDETEEIERFLSHSADGASRLLRDEPLDCEEGRIHA